MATKRGKAEAQGAGKSGTDASAAGLPRETLLQWYRDMTLHRRFEEGVGRAYQMGRIFGFCHLYIGQEALSVGVAAALRPDDQMMSAYRIHAQAIAKGIAPQAVMDELYGRATGCAGGQGGSMHLYDVEKGFLGGWGLVGQQVPTAAGIAWAQRYRGTDAVTVVYLGDGAVHQGALHETLNLCAIWDLPLIILIENNRYGMGTAVQRISSLVPMHGLADAYGLPHGEFDGMDVLATYDALTEAVARARGGKTTLLEARCSRFRGHSMSDPAKYRSREELEAEKALDPIPRLGNFLIGKRWATAESLEAIDEEVKAEVAEMMQRAESAPWPDPADIVRNVYVEPYGIYRR